MELSDVKARVTIEGMGPYHQSKHYEVPKLDGESHEDYDARTWLNHLHVQDGTIHIPARALHSALVGGARYKGTKIAGAGNKQWTAKFQAGTAIFENADLGIRPEDLGPPIIIYANLDGRPGGRSRGWRRFPVINSGWQATFTVDILDPIVTQPIFIEMLTYGGLYIGIGQYRPQNMGTAGRFKIVAVEWQEALQSIPVRRPIIRRGLTQPEVQPVPVAAD